MNLISRGDAGLRRPRTSPVSVAQNGVTFHWNGPAMGSFDHDECGRRVRGIQDFHMGPQRGWNDIAYNFLVCEHAVFVGRGQNVYNAGNGTTVGNRTSHAVMVMVGEGDTLTEGHKAGMRDIAAHLGGPRKVHRDWVNTTCPGDEITDLVRAGIPGSPPPPAPNVPPFEGGPYGRNCRIYTCKGIGVRVIQSRLQQLGHSLIVDGDFGPVTEREVKQHQRAEGIVADGIVGSVTWLHMWT